MQFPRVILSRAKPARREVGTLDDACERIDELEKHYNLLAGAIEASVNGHEKLTTTVEALSKAVEELRTVTKATSANLEQVVTNTEKGRELLSKMLDEIVSRKSSTWATYAIGAGVMSAPQWIPQLLRAFGHG